MNDESMDEILLIEDNHDDAELTIKALKRKNLANQLRHIDDGEEALRYLFDTKVKRFPKLI